MEIKNITETNGLISDKIEDEYTSEKNTYQYNNLPSSFRQSKYLLSKVLENNNTYTSKIFLGIIALWNKHYFNVPRAEFFNYTLQENELRKKNIEIDATSFLKSIGISDEANAKNTKMLYQILHEFSSLTSLELNMIQKADLDLYKTVKSLFLEKINSKLSYSVEDGEITESKVKDLRLGIIQLFEIVYITKATPESPSRFGFRLTDEAIPIFDAISNQYALLNLETVKELQGNEIKIYDFFKSLLGTNSEISYTLWISPSDEIPDSIYNLRTLLNNLEKHKGEYKTSSSDLIQKTAFPNFKRINEKCSDLYIDFISNRSVSGYNTQFIKKGKKIIGIKLKIYNYNPNTKLQSNTLIQKYKNCLYVKEEFLKKNFDLNIIKQETEKTIYNVLRVLDSDKFKEKYWNQNVMTQDIFIQLKKDYLDLCYSYAKANYYNFETNYWNCNLTKMMIFYLLKGKNIYDGQVFKANKYTTWTPGDDIDNYYLKNPAMNPNYIDEKIDKEIPQYLKDFIKKIKEH